MVVQHPLPNFENINEIICFYAEHSPNDIVISAPGRQSINFKVLKERVDELSVTLNNVNNKTKLRIAIIFPNGPEMALAFLAVSSFATAAPLNPQYQTSDLEFYLTDLNADVLLIHAESDSPAREVAKKMDIPVVEAIFDHNKPAGNFLLSSKTKIIKQGNSPALSQSQDIALLLHTSGTTSRPKLVPLSQNNLCSSASNIVKTLKLKQSDRCLNIMPLFHIHGLIASLLASIMAGGSVICTSGLNTDNFFAWIKHLKPTWYTGVPTMHHAILGSTHNNTNFISANNLRFIRSSSSALAPQVMIELEKTFNIPVLEAYGMTEACQQIASNPLPPGQRKPGSVGLPAGPEIVILDEQGNILEKQQSGEIAIQGENVMQGYEGNQEANKTAFAKSWFRTGDLGYIDETGYLFISGRLKEIINRGGEKISPREIDEVLLDHPEIKQAVAFAVNHPSLGEDLVAAIVLLENSRLDTHRVRNFLFEKLPGFKVPSQILILDEIPKGPTGKIQRIGLAEKLAVHFEQPYAEPGTELEKILSSFFSELLKLPKIGSNENFFALGGDSLLAMQLITRVCSNLSVDIPVIAVFQAPTIAELAVLVLKYQAEQLDSDSMADLLTEIEKLSDEDVTKQIQAGTIPKQTRE